MRARGKQENQMSYDLLIKNGRVVDGSGGPSYRGDIAVADGKIVEIGKLSGAAARRGALFGRAHGTRAAAHPSETRLRGPVGISA